MGDAGGTPVEWLWPEYTKEEAELDTDNVRIKKEIAAQYGEDALRRSWNAVCKQLEILAQAIKDGTSLIHVFSYEDFFKMTDLEKEEIKRRGCMVVRGTIPEETAKSWFQDIKTYLQENEGIITGMM